MGIIISSFPGCGKRYLMNTYGDKARIVDSAQDFIDVGEPTTDEYSYDYDLFVDVVMKEIGKYDIIFIPSGKEFLDAFNKRNIDYDIFYPSKERRGEFIENMVRKHVSSKGIMELDRGFDKMVDRIDAIDASNCYKHKMTEPGHFIGNDNAIMGYLNSLKNTNINNAQEFKERVEEPSRSGEDNETHEEGNA